MVLTDDAHSPTRLRALRNLCFRPSGASTTRSSGHNFRLTNLQAAIGVAQIARIAEMVAAQAAHGPALHRPAGRPGGPAAAGRGAWARSVYWMYGLVLDEATGLDAVDFAGRLRGARRRAPGRSSWGCTSSRLCTSAGCSRRALPGRERIARPGPLPALGPRSDGGAEAHVCDAVRGTLA